MLRTTPCAFLQIKVTEALQALVEFGGVQALVERLAQPLELGALEEHRQAAVEVTYLLLHRPLINGFEYILQAKDDQLRWSQVWYAWVHTAGEWLVDNISRSSRFRTDQLTFSDPTLLADPPVPHLPDVVVPADLGQRLTLLHNSVCDRSPVPFPVVSAGTYMRIPVVVLEEYMVLEGMEWRRLKALGLR